MLNSPSSSLTGVKLTKQAKSNYSPFWRILLLFSSFTIVVISIFQVVGIPRSHPNWTIFVSIASIVWISIYFISSYRQFRTPYLFTSAYILIFIIFHLSLSISEALGLLENVEWYVEADSIWLEKSGWYSVMALGCLGIGFSASLRRKDLVENKSSSSESSKNASLSFAYWTGIGLFIASMIFLALAIATFGNLLNYSRLDFFRSVDDTRGVGAFLMVLPSSIILLVIGAQTRFQKYISYAIFGVGFTVLLFSGYRSMALFPLMAGAIIWVKTGRKIPFLVASGIVVAGLVAVSAIGMLRAMGTYSEINLDAVKGSIKQANVQDAIELGGTAIILANTLRLVPKKDQYWFGITYLRHFRNAIPRVMPGKRDASQMNMSNPENVRKLNPGRWITYRLAPWKYKGGEGLGFSAVGEAYINFGLVGVLVFFCGLGFFLGRLESVNLLRNPKLLVFVTVAFWPLLKTVRNDFGVFLKPLFFTLIIIMIWHVSTKLFVRSRRI